MNTMPSPGPASRNLWPHAIIAWFFVFGGAMAAWIVVAVRQNMDLVRADYYEQEIRYQEQLDRIGRTTALGHAASLTHDPVAQCVILQVPPDHARQGVQGRIDFYRPSNAKRDRQMALDVGPGGFQRIPAAPLDAGLWKVRAQWTAGGEDYFLEHILLVPSPHE